MKAIILAAGEGTRLRPVTHDIPKAMVELGGKPLMEYNMESLIPYVSEFIIVVKYKKEKIQDYFKNTFAGIPVSYHEQGDEKGTGAAIKGISAEEDVVIVYADTIVSSQDIEKAMKEKDYTVFVKEVKEPSKYGIYLSDSQGFALEVIEKPSSYIGNLANMGFFKVHKDILKYVDDIELSQRGEYELTDAINLFLKEYKLKLILLENPITDITSLENLTEENKKYTEKYKKILTQKPKFGESIVLGNIQGLELHFGISQKNIEKLIIYSADITDRALQENTGDLGRFSQREKIEKWYNDTERYVFTLVGQEGDLAGIWWGRPSIAPEISEVFDTETYQILQKNEKILHTSGVRIYGEFRGKKLATPFIKKCTYLYSSIFPGEILCVDVNKNNIAMQRVYEKTKHRKVGYGENKKSIEASSHKRIIYIQELPSCITQ